MSKMTAQEIAEKQARNLVGSIEDIRRGVERCEVNPCERAAAKADKWLASITASKDKWKSALARTPKESWVNGMINKGLNRISAGIEAAKAKTVSFYEQLLPYQESLKSSLANAPDVTLEDRLQKMVNWSRGMAKFKRTR